MRDSKETYYVKMLAVVAARSTCARRSVGAIITDEQGIVLATSYNGAPSGFVHCTESPCPGALDPGGDTRRCQAIHAEQNALLTCHRLDLAHTMYVTVIPCFVCAKLILNTSIERVIATGPYTGDELGAEMLKKAEILYLYDYESTRIQLVF